MRYLDTSAAMKLLVEEPESAELAEALDRCAAEDRLVSSWLLHTELQCALGRRPRLFDSDAIESVRAGSCGARRPRASGPAPCPDRGRRVRSQDTIHLAVAVRVRADAMLTYDLEQVSAARAAGMQVQHPGAAASR